MGSPLSQELPLLDIDLNTHSKQAIEMQIIQSTASNRQEYSKNQLHNKEQWRKTRTFIGKREEKVQK